MNKKIDRQTDSTAPKSLNHSLEDCDLEEISEQQVKNSVNNKRNKLE